MKKTLQLVFIAGGLITANIAEVDAQVLKNLQKKVEKKVEDKADDLLRDRKSKQGDAENNVPSENPTGSVNRQGAADAYSFLPGQKVIFENDLSEDALGRMPRYWKTHSTGAVTEVPGVEGKWFKVSNKASYQLDTMLNLPEKFTLEFELLTRSNQAGDLRDMHFGFTKNPSPQGYLYGVSADNTVVSTFLQFYYNSVRNSSNDTKLKNSINVPLDNLGNSVIPVAIEVDGTNMRVFVNKQSVLDAEVLRLESPKHFYFSNGNPRNDAQVYIGKIRIAE